MRKLKCFAIFVVLCSVFACGEKKSPTSSEPSVRSPSCTKPEHSRIDALTPESMVADWGQPMRLGSPINTTCPEDAIEISADGQTLYFYFTEDLIDNLPPDRIFSPQNGTWRARRIGGPSEFDKPTFYDLGKGIDQSLDGELSFTPDGDKVYFHSARATNTGYQNVPPTDDFADIYVADIVAGEPGPGLNLGPPVNSVYPDGEHALHPDGVTLYFTSTRPGGLGKNDIWISSLDGTSWSNPTNPGGPINTVNHELQPAFTSDGNTMYFVSDRNSSIGGAIYRSNRSGNTWGDPEAVIKGIVGEPSITADGKLLYFVHGLTDRNGVFDVDVWVCERNN